MTTEANKATKRRYWAKRMQDPAKRAEYLEYQRAYYRENMADPVMREYERQRRRENKAKKEQAAS